MAKLIYTYDNPPSERDLEEACKILYNDGVIAYPTDVNWAFGCDAANVKALDKIRLLKPSRPKERPFSLLCSDISMASTIGNITHSSYRFLKKAWPGPYTIIVQRNKNLARQIKDKRKVVGIRIPNSPLILALVKKFGSPLATTSIPNMPNEIPISMGYQVEQYFGHGINLILDLGEQSIGRESTIIDFTEGYPTLVRPGVGDPSIFDL